MFFLANHNLSFYGHSSKSVILIASYSGLFLSALGLQNRVLASSSFTKRYWLFFIHFHYKMLSKCNLRAPNLQYFLGVCFQTPLSLHYQKCGHHIVCSIRVFKMDFPVFKLSIVAYPPSIGCPSLVSITEAIA